jgi:DUF4097 and DUF4098 domain-containing protein YvlB
MAKEENLLILKMLQEGKITAEQASELLLAVEKGEPVTEEVVSDASEATAEAEAKPRKKTKTPVPPQLADKTNDSSEEGDTLSRARARIAAAREKVAGVQEKLSAAEDKLTEAEKNPNTNPARSWEQVADALRDVPGARSVTEALRDPRRLASSAQRQARKITRTLRNTVEDWNLETLVGQMQGEPTLTSTREAFATIPPEGILRVRNNLGGIEAIGADVKEVKVAGMVRIWAANMTEAETLADSIELIVEQLPEGPTITVQHPPKVKRVHLDLKVFVPQEKVKVSLLAPSGDVIARNLKGLGVVLATQSGDATAIEIFGDVVAETTSGDINAEGIIGNVIVSASSGSITAKTLSGQVFKATTQSGDIALRDSTIPTINLETVSGNETVENCGGKMLTLKAVSGDLSATGVVFAKSSHLDTVSGSVDYAPKSPLSAGAVTVNTISGNLKITLPLPTNGTIDMRSKSGSVKGEWLQDGKEEGDAPQTKAVSGDSMVALSEKIGDGSGVQISLSSLSGDIKIKQEKPTEKSSEKTERDE